MFSIKNNCVFKVNFHYLIMIIRSYKVGTHVVMNIIYIIKQDSNFVFQ